MRVLIATSDVPFVEGGHRVIARSLQRALQEAGHSSEILTTPQNRFGRQFASYLATRLTDVELTGNGERIDRLISLRFPSYLLKHPHHVCWLNHRMREYYDLWPEWSSKLSTLGRLKENVRRKMIHSADHYFLTKNLEKLFAQSKNIQSGLLHWGKIPSEVLYPPPPQRNYRTEEYGDFIFSPSRLTPLKRVDFLIEALAITKNARAVISGDGVDRERLESLIKNHGLQDRVQLTGEISEDQLVNYYSRCRAVYYAPTNEDFGLVTMEAFASGKAVITANDSGGPTELVQDRINGFIVTPQFDAIAKSVEALFEDRSLAETLGAAARESANKITWSNTITRLLT